MERRDNSTFYRVGGGHATDMTTRTMPMVWGISLLSVTSPNAGYPRISSKDELACLKDELRRYSARTAGVLQALEVSPDAR